MQSLALFVDHFRALAEQLVNDFRDILFVAGDGRGGNDNPVSGHDIHLLMGGKSHPIQGGHIFSLRAGGNDDNFVLGQALDGRQIHNGARLHLQIAQLLGNLEHILHAPPGYGHLPAIALGCGKHCLNPMHIGSKGRHNNAAVTVAELPVQALRHHIFAGGIALALHIGGIGQQRQHALLAKLSKPGKIHHPVLRSGINLEIAGKHHGSHRGFDGESHRVGNGMVHMDELHGEAASLDHIAGLVGYQLDRVGQMMLFQLQLDQPIGHGGAMDGAIHLLHTVGNGADMIFVAVGNEHTPQLLLVGHQIGKVGDHQIHAIHILLREAHAAVHHDHVLAVFQDGDVLADFIQTAQGDNSQFFCQIK